MQLQSYESHEFHIMTKVGRFNFIQSIQSINDVERANFMQFSVAALCDPLGERFLLAVSPNALIERVHHLVRLNRETDESEDLDTNAIVLWLDEKYSTVMMKRSLHLGGWTSPGWEGNWNSYFADGGGLMTAGPCFSRRVAGEQKLRFPVIFQRLVAANCFIHHNGERLCLPDYSDLRGLRDDVRLNARRSAAAQVDTAEALDRFIDDRNFTPDHWKHPLSSERPPYVGDCDGGLSTEWKDWTSLEKYVRDEFGAMGLDDLRNIVRLPVVIRHGAEQLADPAIIRHLGDLSIGGEGDVVRDA